MIVAESRKRNGKKCQNCRKFATAEIVCFVVLPPKSTAMVSSPNHASSLAFLNKLHVAVNQYFVHMLSLVTDNNPS